MSTVLPTSSNSLFKIEKLVLKARSLFDSFTGIGSSCFGVLEYWSVGKNKSPNFNLNWFLHYSITPQLHHSSKLRQEGKSMEAPSEGSPKPGPLGPDSLF